MKPLFLTLLILMFAISIPVYASQDDPAANRIKESVVAANVVPATYATLMDSGTVFMRNNMQVVNGLNASISIRFKSGDSGDNAVTIQAGATRDFRYLKNYGILEYEYVSGQPTTGTLTVSVW